MPNSGYIPLLCSVYALGSGMQRKSLTHIYASFFKQHYFCYDLLSIDKAGADIDASSSGAGVPVDVMISWMKSE